MHGAKPVLVDIEAGLLHDGSVGARAGDYSADAGRSCQCTCSGNPPTCGRIVDIARRHRLVVIEDACQAHGAEHDGRRAGSLGDIGCFSFYPTKNLGAFGEGGAAVTSNCDYADVDEADAFLGRAAALRAFDEGVQLSNGRHCRVQFSA